jgi:hypothetical protein
MTCQIIFISYGSGSVLIELTREMQVHKERSVAGLKKDETQVKYNI